MDCERCAKLHKLLEKEPTSDDLWKAIYTDIYLLYFTGDAMRDSTDTNYQAGYEKPEEETKDLTETMTWGYDDNAAQ